MDTPIIDMLSGAAKSAAVRFCMPGHKGKPAFLEGEVDFLDVTELPGVDKLYNPEGAILRSQRLYASSIGARESHYLVNGSTTGVQASILAGLEPGSKILVARDVHLSAVSALILAGLEPVFIGPKKRDRANLPAVLRPDEVEHAISMNPDAKALFVTYPNYYGLCLDLEPITAMAHEAKQMLICDAAHAAAFDFSQYLPASPAQCGCDMWTVSLHKTLPAMNQCAALNVGSSCQIETSTIQTRINWLQTTSPSYLLLASSEYATALMRDEGAMLLARQLDLVQDAVRRIGKLGGYNVLTNSVPYATGAYDCDKLRLVIDVSDRGLTGLGAARDLARRGVAVEAADLSSIILICTVADTREDYDRLIRALQDIRGGIYSIEQSITNADVFSLYGTEFVTPLAEAARAKTETVPLQESADRIAAVCVGLYPPGVPVLMPGQQITADTARILEKLRRSGYGTFGFSDTIEVVSSKL